MSHRADLHPIVRPRPGGPVWRLADRTRPWRAAGAVALAGYLTLTVVLFSLGTVVTVLFDGTWLERADHRVSTWFEDNRTGWADRVTEVVSTLGDTLPVVAVTAAAALFCALRRRWREALVVIVGLVLELSVFLSTTWVVGRDRPPVERLDSTPSTASWPSGHVAAALVLWAGLALLVAGAVRHRAVVAAVWVVGIGMPLAMAVARIYRGMHFATDTLGGLLLGAGALSVAVAAMRASAVDTVTADR